MPIAKMEIDLTQFNIALYAGHFVIFCEHQLIFLPSAMQMSQASNKLNLVVVRS
jgi:hypothetical protein